MLNPLSGLVSEASICSSSELLDWILRKTVLGKWVFDGSPPPGSTPARTLPLSP